MHILEQLLTHYETTGDDFKHDRECNYCRMEIIGTIYLCLECDQYALCQECYRFNFTNNSHKKGHKILRTEKSLNLNTTVNFKNLEERFQTEIHQGIDCSVCKIPNINGLRYKCLECFDFNSCSNCKDETNETHLRTHSMLVLCKSVSSEIDSSKVEFLENGSFGAVKSAKYEGKIFARKIIEKLKMGPSHHFEIEGDNILKMIGHCFMDQEKDKVVLLFDIMSKGSLRELMEKEPELINSKRFEIAQGIASGLAYLHKIDFIHKGFTPANIFISNEYVPKIRCISLAREGSNQSFDYMPTEYYASKYDQQSDVFSFGLILNELFKGKHKLNDKRIEIVKECDVIFDLIVSHLIEIKPENRPNSRTTNQIFSFINSFILRQINLNKEYFSASYDNSKRNQDFEQYFMKGYECYTETKLKDSKKRDKASTKKKLDFYLEELENAQIYNDPNKTELIHSIDSVSFLYACLEDVENSIKYAEMSFEKRKDISDFQLALGYAGLGFTYLKAAKKPQEAKKNYTQALDLLKNIFKNEKNPYIASWNYKLGRCCFELKELDEAIEFHRKSYEMRKSIYEPDSYYILKSLEELVDCYSKKNDTDNFFFFRKELIRLKKCIFKSKNKNKDYKDVVLFKGKKMKNRHGPLFESKMKKNTKK